MSIAFDTHHFRFVVFGEKSPLSYQYQYLISIIFSTFVFSISKIHKFLMVAKVSFVISFTQQQRVLTASRNYARCTTIYICRTVRSIDLVVNVFPKYKCYFSRIHRSRILSFLARNFWKLSVPLLSVRRSIISLDFRLEICLFCIRKNVSKSCGRQNDSWPKGLSFTKELVFSNLRNSGY